MIVRDVLSSKSSAKNDKRHFIMDDSDLLKLKFILLILAL